MHGKNFNKSLTDKPPYFYYFKSLKSSIIIFNRRHKYNQYLDKHKIKDFHRRYNQQISKPNIFKYMAKQISRRTQTTSKHHVTMNIQIRSTYKTNFSLVTMTKIPEKTHLTFGFPPCCNISFVTVSANSVLSPPTSRWNGEMPFLAKTMFASAPFVVMSELTALQNWKSYEMTKNKSRTKATYHKLRSSIESYRSDAK